MRSGRACLVRHAALTVVGGRGGGPRGWRVRPASRPRAPRRGRCRGRSRRHGAGSGGGCPRTAPETRDGSLGADVVHVGLELDAAGAEHLEGVGEQQQLGVGVDGAAPHGRGVGGRADLESGVGHGDVEVRRGADDRARAPYRRRADEADHPGEPVPCQSRPEGAGVGGRAVRASGRPAATPRRGRGRRAAGGVALGVDRCQLDDEAEQPPVWVDGPRQVRPWRIDRTEVGDRMAPSTDVADGSGAAATEVVVSGLAICTRTTPGRSSSRRCSTYPRRV